MAQSHKKGSNDMDFEKSKLAKDSLINAMSSFNGCQGQSRPFKS